MERSASREIPVEMVQFLIVDDHNFVRHIVSECLKTHDIKRLSFAQDGSEALHLLTRLSPQTSGNNLIEMFSERPDIAGDLLPESANFKAGHAHCVITDFKMGDVNGLHLLQSIRAGLTSLPRDTPVILLTGFSDDFVVAAALQLDVNAFVLKPVSNRTLWEKVQRVLKSVLPVKDAATYKNIIVPDDEGQNADSGAKTPKPELAPGDGVRRIPLSAVLPGAILARDLHGARGALLLREGTVFSPGIIQKLLDLERMSGLDGEIPIRPDRTK